MSQVRRSSRRRALAITAAHGARATNWYRVNTIITTGMSDCILVVASFSAPRDTSAPSNQNAVLSGQRVTENHRNGRPGSTSTSLHSTRRDDRRAEVTTSAPRFVHSRNGEPPPVGRGLAQPAV